MSDPLAGLNVGPPPAGGSGSGPSPIGVPKYFLPGIPPDMLTQRISVPDPTLAGPFLPGRPETFPSRTVTTYLSGYEFTPASWSVEERARMQEALDAAGLFKPNDQYTRGFWDDNSAAAFKRLLGYANQMGKDWEQSIVELGTLNQANVGKARSRAAAGRAPVFTEISSPDDLKLVFDRTARQLLGRKMSESELDSMVKAYSGIEIAEAQKRIGAQSGQSNVISTGAPSPTAFGERQIESQFGEEAFAHRFAQKFDVFNKMLGGIG
jgi:hypothetical protein